MRGVSEITSAVVLMAITLAALTSVLGYYGRAMGDAWFSLQKDKQVEEYISGVKVRAFEKGGMVWLYNYGWNEAEIELVEVDGLPSSWNATDVATGEATNLIRPGSLVALSLGQSGQNVTVYLKGGLVIRP